MNSTFNHQVALKEVIPTKFYWSCELKLDLYNSYTAAGQKYAATLTHT